MAFIHDSRRRGPDPYYRWKVAAFTVGAAFGLAGIFTHYDALVLVAVPILALGVGLRWLPRRGEPGEAPEETVPGGEAADEVEAAPDERADEVEPAAGEADAAAAGNAPKPRASEQPPEP